MTMNDNWGYNRADKNFKSTKELLHNLADIASKGGNFLLNVGPTAEGLFPTESIQRLKEMGEWMSKNGESIHGTTASPLGSYDWGRVTMKTKGGNTLLYLHVFEAPRDQRIVLNGLASMPTSATYLAAPMAKSPVIKKVDDAVLLELPREMPDKHNSVIVLQFNGKPRIYLAPEIHSPRDVFTKNLEVTLSGATADTEIRYTLDGSTPKMENSKAYKVPISLTKTTTVSARLFSNGQPISGATQKTLTQLEPKGSSSPGAVAPGLQYFYFEGDWTKLPNFDKMMAVKKGTVANFDRSAKNALGERYGFEFRGFIKVPEASIYTFSTASDDGSSLTIDQELVVDNDGLHGTKKVSGNIALQAGYHEIVVRYFNQTGGEDLKVTWASESLAEQPIPDAVFFHVPRK